MKTRGIRGAITVDNNSCEGIKDATVELVNAIISKNEINLEDVAFAIFTVTSDIDEAFPAKFAREYCNFKDIPMMCYREMEVKNSIKMCLRALITVNTDKTQKEIKHQYLKGATHLRPDITE